MNFYAQNFNIYITFLHIKTMRKSSIAAAVLCISLACANCKKEQVQQSRIANMVVDETKKAVEDFIVEPHSSNKSNLGQADIN